MYSGVPCYWVDETGRWGIRLRRFTFTKDKECPAGGTHDASSGIVYMEQVTKNPGGTFPAPVAQPRSHWAWPDHCEACGYLFEADDQWQTNGDVEWRRADTGELLVARADRLPPGALYSLDWHGGEQWNDRYGDGLDLHAVCPNGIPWHVDGSARPGDGSTVPEAWARTGDPRVPETLSVTPSIVSGDYHGFLTAGRFTDG